ncbi:Rib/alpha-like domain-containing protein [Corynebacterium jeikeium]|uniref:Rib/alpha-like domain-containing protein n=1 Tax=Corynebacterium jeikeium TaxID=38289 RepID=UPI00088CD885|nr:Rib/alpha-like domain-containing protein [Corynebacterium jeikeium]SCX02051.1 C protein alpha-antigen precursor [Corynebacterium jeikeium]
MMFLRSRRTMTAVAAAASLVLTATAVPQSPFSPVAAQAATANKTQDTSLPLKCTISAGGNLAKENMDFAGKVHVEMPETARQNEVVTAKINIDRLVVSDPKLGSVWGMNPSFESGNTQRNKVRFYIPGDVELVNSNLGATLDNHVLTVERMMKPGKLSRTSVFVDFAPLELKLKAKNAGKLEIQTPTEYLTNDTAGRVNNNNMFYGEGQLRIGIGLRVACRTGQYKPLGVTQVGEAADFNEPKYDSIQVKQQDSATSKNTAQAPAGTTYAKGANAPEWATVGQDGTVTVKPGLDVKPGDYTVPVVVTYPDSSTDNAVVNVTVKEKEKSLAEQHDPQFGETTVEQEGAATIAAPEGLPEGTKVAAGEGAPEWVTVKEDGSIEAKPTRETEAKQYTVPVVVTYPDKSTDEATAKVTVAKKPDNQIYSPEFGSITVQANRSAKTSAIEGLPEGTKFALAEGAPEWASIDDKGVVQLNPGGEVDVKDYTVPVTVTYPDGTTDNAELKVTVTERAINEIHDPTYSDATVKQGDEVTAPAPTDVAEGAKFAAGEGAPEWATVNEDGSVTVKPGLEVAGGKYTVPVKVTYPDNSADDTTVNVTVTVKPANEIHDPTYSDVTVKQGDEVTAPAPTDVAEGAIFEAGEGVPSWIIVNPDGTVTAKPGTDVEAKEYTVPVKVSYKDGSGDDTVVNVTVTVKPANEIHDPSFEDVSVKPGETVTSKVPGDTGEGAKFTAGEGAPEWATVKPDGTVTLKPGKDVEPGEYTVPVEITYSDGSSSTVELKVNVEKQGKPSGSSGSSSSSGVAGSSPLGKFFAALFGTIAIGAGLFGLYNWARDHGYVR